MMSDTEVDEAAPFNKAQCDWLQSFIRTHTGLPQPREGQATTSDTVLPGSTAQTPTPPPSGELVRNMWARVTDQRLLRTRLHIWSARRPRGTTARAGSIRWRSRRTGHECQTGAAVPLQRDGRAGLAARGRSAGRVLFLGHWRRYPCHRLRSRPFAPPPPPP